MYRTLLPRAAVSAALLLSTRLAGQSPPDFPTTPQADSVAARGAPAGAPVVVEGDTLFFVYGRLGPFGPSDRALAIAQRIERLAGDPVSRGGMVRIAPGEISTDLVIGDQVVASITDADAGAAGVARPVLAASAARELGRVLQEQSWATRLRVIALGVLFALLVALATVGVIKLVNRLFPRLFAAIDRGRTTWLPSLRVQRLELLSADQLADGLLWVGRVVRIGIVIVLLYLSIPAILSFFPWTRPYADLLFGYILTPFAAIWTALIAYLPNLFTIGAIVAVTWYLLRLIRPIFVGLARGSITIGGFFPEWAIPTYKIVRVLVLILSFIAIWPYIPGSGSPAFQGVGVFLGLLVSLGSAAAVGNMIGGVLLTYMRPFKVGDRVKIADTEGDVVEKSLLVTRIRTTKNVDITVPNAMVLSSHIINYSSSAKAHGLILHTTVTIGYDVPWRQVHELLLGAAADTPDLVAEPAPFILQTSLDDFYVSYELNAYTNQPNRMPRTYSALHAAIQDRFNQAGVEIMSPHYRAARDGNQSTIPAENLPADYQTPSFRMESTGGRG